MHVLAGENRQKMDAGFLAKFKWYSWVKFALNFSKLLKLNEFLQRIWWNLNYQIFGWFA